MKDSSHKRGSLGFWGSALIVSGATAYILFSFLGADYVEEGLHSGEAVASENNIEEEEVSETMLVATSSLVLKEERTEELAEEEVLLEEPKDPVVSENPPETKPQEGGCSDGWRITGYFTPVEAEYDTREEFEAEVRVEGWGLELDGGYTAWYGGAWHSGDAALDSLGNELNLNTVAVDTDIISHGSKISIPGLPGEYGERVYAARDVGYAVLGKHIDVFTGEGLEALEEAYSITGNNLEVCIL